MKGTLLIIVFVSLSARGDLMGPTTDSTPKPLPSALKQEMAHFLDKMDSKKGWQEYLSTSSLCGAVSDKQPIYVAVDQMRMKVGADDYLVGISCRSVFIKAAVKTAVAVTDDPQYFQALYELDKTAVVGPKAKDGTYESHVYKVIKGIGIQDYTLDYHSHWDGPWWIERVPQKIDAKGFGLRDNVKRISPHDHGSVYSEVALFWPNLWWLRLGPMQSLLQKVTNSELQKLSRAVKCASERVAKGETMSTHLAEQCASGSLP